MVNQAGTINIIVELRKLIDIIPNCFVTGYKNVCAILMRTDAGNRFRVSIFGDMTPPVNGQAFILFLCERMGKDRVSYQQVVLRIPTPFCLSTVT